MEMDDEAVAPRAELESARTTGPALCSNRRCRTSVRQPLLRRRREATCLSDGDKVSKMPTVHAWWVCPQTYKVFLRGARRNYVRSRRGSCRRSKQYTSTRFFPPTSKPRA